MTTPYPAIACLETERLTWVKQERFKAQDAAGYVCTKREFEPANGDDEDEEEEEEKKKEKDEEDEEDEDDDDDDDGAIQRLRGHGRAATLRPAPFPG